MDTLVNVESLSVKYHRFFALKDITFSMNRGEFVAVIGANGSGKTTLIKTLMNLLKPYRGTVVFPHSPTIGYLPQHTSMLERNFPATVEEIVGTGLLNTKIFPKRLNKKDYERINEVLTYLDMAAMKKKRIGALSGGQQQRVLLARAIVSNPDLLILDEPTSALDQSMREHFYHLMSHLNKDLGVSVMLVTHDIASAGEYVSRVLYLDQTLEFDGDFREFCETQPQSPFIHTHPTLSCGGSDAS